MRKTVGILGLGVFGMTIAKQLSEYDCDIIAVDRDEVNVNRIEPLVTKAVIADVTDEDVLKEIGIGDCDTVVVATGSSLEASILAVMHCTRLGVPEIIAKAKSRTTTEILTKMGAQRVVNPEKETGIRLVKNILHHKLAEVIALDGNISLVEFYPPKSWVGKRLSDLDLRKDYDLNLIGYREAKNESLNTKIFADFLIREDVVLVAIIGTDSLDKATFLED
ncbi:Ktr system potassium uptake protein A [Granulicatella adiacens]|uniref:potassium channel family protein n=1 Tax=Granulicatella TaxID=117563 RepID=UPI0008A4F2C7|nr:MULTISPECIES: TrkA family potassium uptake protein [Granulicatella]MBF1211212.1 TrkA family potassium uptake protein [Granulicatella sp.]OFT01852.1 potassium transporter Trk [Granulicatella sp. HMSC31F03]VTX72349.1 Ktr system potassium uptake protein A [Granulicatella adiacens]